MTYHAAWLSDTQWGRPLPVAALDRAQYLIGEVAARVTGTVPTLGGAYALFKTFPLEQRLRDGTSAPTMLPSSDAFLAS